MTSVPKKPIKRGRLSYREAFLNELNKLSENGKNLVSNRALKEALDWEEEKYKRIKLQLVDERVIFPSRGYGGTVGLTSPKGTKALNLFISYSHRDESYKDDLQNHLTPLKRLGLIEEWNDRKINAGTEWDRAISEKLESAHIVLLLISIDFISSKYCYDIEMERALERHGKGETVVIPVIIRNCLWQHSAFSKLQAVPKDARAVASHSDRDEALTGVVDAIRIVAEKLLAEA
jgi:TIR domain